MVILLGYVTFIYTLSNRAKEHSHELLPCMQMKFRQRSIRYIILRIHTCNDVCMHHVLKEPQADLDINFLVLEVDCATTLNAKVERHLNSL